MPYKTFIFAQGDEWEETTRRHRSTCQAVPSDSSLSQVPVFQHFCSSIMQATVLKTIPYHVAPSIPRAPAWAENSPGQGLEQ